MIDEHTREAAPGRGATRIRILRLGLAGTLATVAAALAAAMALAASTVALDSASNSKMGQSILVSSSGRTLYALSPETTHHLLCKSAECLKFWPPVTVSSSHEKIKLGHGVHGKTGFFKRSNGTMQVTLNGQPLYRFAEDGKSGEVNGQNFKGFGGIWHVLGDTGKPSSKTPASAQAPASSESSGSTTTTTTTGSNGYGY